MTDTPNEGRDRPTSEFWITLALLTIATIITLILLNNGRTDQKNIGNKTTYLHSTIIDSNRAWL